MIAIVVPACDESLTIAATIEAFHSALPEVRCVVVDNDSADGMARRLHAHDGAPPRQGSGMAFAERFWNRTLTFMFLSKSISPTQQIASTT